MLSVKLQLIIIIIILMFVNHYQCIYPIFKTGQTNKNLAVKVETCFTVF